MYETDLNSRIGEFYDTSSKLWEKTWGEHMHHGYYRNGENKTDYQAQVDLIEELLDWGQIERPTCILDAGCGIGGSAIYLAKKFGAAVTGLTLSAVQAIRARELAEQQGFSERINFEVKDILDYEPDNKQFDLIWSLESAEHFSDKRKFIKNGSRLLKAGGKLLMATWCHRPVPPELSAGEEKFLRNLYKAYHLPYIISIDEYAQLAKEYGFHKIQIADWTEEVAPFWNAVRRSALHPKTLVGIIEAGWPTIRGALAMNLMIKGYQNGLIRFGVLQATKV